jgi:uncharacterized protein YyaL (SSP411 family)
VLEDADAREGDSRSRSLRLATRAAVFVRERLWDEERRVLLRRERAGQAGIDGFAEDYAFLIWGLLELFQAGGDAVWLTWATELQDVQDRLFWDAEQGGWFSTSGRDPSVLLRMKEDYDGAEPSAASVAVQNALILSHLIDRDDWRGRAEATLARIGSRAGDLARQIPFMMGNVALFHAGVQQIVIVGRAEAPETRALWRVVSERYLPFAVVIPVEPGAPQVRLAQWLPWIKDMTPQDGRATAFVCRHFACELPVSDAEALRARLAAMSDTLDR